MTNHEAAKLGWRHLNAGRDAEARELFAQVLAHDANYAAALHGMGWVEYLQNRKSQAADFLARALRADPLRAEAQFHLGILLHDEGRREAALERVRRAAALSPGVAMYRAALGMLYQDLEKWEQARDCYREAERLNPNDAEMLAHLSHVLCTLDEGEQAAAVARRAVGLRATWANGHLKLGYALLRTMDLSGAERAFLHALELDADMADAQMGLAEVMLTRGDFPRGWAGYERRFDLSTRAVQFPQLESPRWDGTRQPGKTMLVQTEQGLGDSIQFARFLLPLRERVGKVIVRSPPPLVELLRSISDVEVVADDSPPPEHDLHVPMMSLARLLGTTLDALPGKVPYLHAKEEKRAYWRERVARLGGVRVGLAWAGNPSHLRDRARSIAAKNLAPLAEAKSVSWVSLQTMRNDPAPPLHLHDFTAELNDFSDTAALIAELDLVLSVDTAIAHLAGALGQRAWTLVPFATEWRWLAERTDSPWYPTMRLFRQPRQKDWAAVLGRVVEELNAFTRDRS